ncbi:hypothetical protein K439DRAFT_944356 [Ramaria rubella]|nr:hypothetical protein K439DRAFT_944356 [Ramaria rubella]
MFGSIILPIVLSLIASTSAFPLAARDATAPPACAALSRRSLTTSHNVTLSRRIAQSDLPSIAQQWQDLCQASGGDITTGDPCVQLAGVRGINALLANGGVCDQLNVADDMFDFANSAGVNNADALKNYITTVYAVHPRNALALAGDITPSTPFCQTPPKNSELAGLNHGQLDGVNPGLFGGPSFTVVAFGDPVSCPLGKTPDVSTCTCK